MEASALMVKYARGFRFEKLGDETVLIIADPMRAGREIARYRLLSTGSQKKPETGYTDIRVPVTSLAASSTTHAGFLAAIDSRDRLIGCNNPERLFDTLLLDRFKKGNLVRTGRDLDYNLEFLIASKPGLVLQTGIDGRFSPDARLTESGIPVMFILEWMEPTPLGRAEWIKVFGVITGRTWEADSIFRSMESNYLNLADRGRNTSVKIKVLTGNVFKGTWYMPGGKNYMTRFFEDAGMDYIWKDNDQSSSLALSFESVVYRLADAPVWINVNVDSISELLASEERYTAFRAVREKHVYSISNRINSHGGNDFWEGGIVHPDLVLADLLAIAHPELIPDHSWNYYKPLVFD
jgi:iron complex transport system substrate-binding protein